ncbi:hypothetical protein F4561_004604 [Lipingzhangella halophila]|uniref:Uncharacterized protein n=1 Tax=Lipingzhangella halophila TaxID=1783352 RepID=A0A7W7RKR3_9ACTN|nr:hypothetical protein [Lipingzhangella halophila]
MRRSDGIGPAPTNIVAHVGRWYFGSLVEQPVRAIDDPL